MSQVLITLKNPQKLDLLLDLLQELNFIQDTKVLGNGEDRSISLSEAEQAVYYSKKGSYSFEDIKAIAEQFPESKKWTYSELVRIFPPDLKVKLEILNSKLIIMPAPSLTHQKISNRLSNRLINFVEEYDLGDILVAPTDVKFDEDNVEQPDTLFIAIQRRSIQEAQYVNIVPNLIVEIISPSNLKKEQAEKRALYEQRGVEEYWTIFPKKRYVKVEVLEEDRYKTFSEVEKEGKVQSSVLAGFEIGLKDLMPEDFFFENKESKL